MVAPILLIFLRINEHTANRPILLVGSKCVVATQRKLWVGHGSRCSATHDFRKYQRQLRRFKHQYQQSNKCCRTFCFNQWHVGLFNRHSACEIYGLRLRYLRKTNRAFGLVLRHLILFIQTLALYKLLTYLRTYVMKR